MLYVYNVSVGGVFGEQPANEYCFTVTNTTIKATTDPVTKYATVYMYSYCMCVCLFILCVCVCVRVRACMHARVCVCV